ncbi:MAG: tetratricopeptide repeat protein [Cyanobacteria bacterium J06623_4]
MLDVWTRYNSARSLYQQGKVNEAAQAYRKLIAEKKDFAWSHYELAKLYQEQSRFTPALHHFQAAISLSPDYPWSYFEAGNIYFKQQKFDAAAAHFSKVVAFQPEAMWGNYWLAMSLDELGDKAQAISTYQTAAPLFEKSKKYHQAISIYQRIVELDGDNVTALYKLARLLDREDNWRAAAIAYKKAIQLMPEPAHVCRELIALLQRHAQIADALKMCQQLIDIESEYYWNYGLLAGVLLDVGDRPKALIYYQQAVEKRIHTSQPTLGYRSSEECHSTNKQVDFFVIGFAKTATTSLFNYLIQHPQILPPYCKEPHFFSKFAHYGMDWYLSQFPDTTFADTQNKRQNKRFITGEGSINYIENLHAPQRIFEQFPQAKLIVSLREPVQRTLSDYHMWIREGWEHRPLEQVIDFELSQLADSTVKQLTKGDHWRYENRYGFVTSYLLRSLYVYHIQRWLAVFPREQFFFLEADQLSKAPQQTLSQLFDFLGVDDYHDINYRQHNRGAYYKKNQNNNSATTRLRAFFKPHNALLEACLERTFDW